MADASAKPNEALVDEPFPPVPVDLRNRHLAALLAWLWPGAGHLYQRRYGKGMLYMVCILVIYFWGLAMGDGHVVYASFRKSDIRFPFIFQAAVGLPAMPAVVQSVLRKHDLPLLFGSDIMAPPAAPVTEQYRDELAVWHEKSGFFFELGTLYTMIAGILNVLAIYDALYGPAFTPLRSGSSQPTKESSTADATTPEPSST